MSMVHSHSSNGTYRRGSGRGGVFCETGVMERPRYFPRQLITPDEMILEQDYFRDRMRRHNRLLHGWGVVCGAIVCRVPVSSGKHDPCAPCNDDFGYPKGRRRDPAGGDEDLCPDNGDPRCWQPWDVRVSSGYILGPYGDEIVIGSEVVVDVRKSCTTGISGDICPPPPDPWCSDVIVDRVPGPLYLAVRYKEISTRPVPVQPAGCSCDDSACEYSRIRDGFEICTLDHCPESHHEDPPELTCELRPCPPCPEDPWVVLARIDINASGIYNIDNYDCRRVVIQAGGLWCYPTPPDDDDRLEDERPTEAELDEREREVLAEHLSGLPAEAFLDVASIRELAELNAIELRGVTANSLLGRRLENEDMTISVVVDMGRDEFLDFCVEGVDDSVRARVRNQAERVWDRAYDVMVILEGIQRM